jgi:hypothetical protein
VGCSRRRVGGGDGGDSKLESGEGMAEREGRHVGPEMVKARCVGGEATGVEVFTYQVCSPLHSFY